MEGSRPSKTSKSEPSDDVAVTEIIGVIYPPGAGGVKLKGLDVWSLRFSFEPWKPVGGSINQAALNVRKRVSQAELSKLMAEIKPFDVLRARMEIFDDEPDGNLIELLGKDTSDPEMLRCSEELQKPITTEDPFFGVFTLNRSVNWNEADTEWMGAPIKLQLDMDECDDFQSFIALARSLWDSQDTWNERICDYAVSQLLGLKNSSWNDDGNPEVTADDFKLRMRLESITLYPDGAFEFWHNDGDLFYGHSILVRGTLSDGPTGADIPG